MTKAEFEKNVRDALRSLPKRIKEKLKNIDVVVEDGRGPDDVMGLYEGVPLGERGEGYSMVLPDKITLYKKSIEAECRQRRLDLRREIRQTVCHEIAHHFGISDDRLDEIDAY